MIWCVEDDASIRDIEVYALTSTVFAPAASEYRLRKQMAHPSAGLCIEST